jgi:hypothetical protein
MNPEQPKKPEPLCSTCNDTHRMTLHGPMGDGARDREVPCTACPIPCDACRGSFSAFCAVTPCSCECHTRDRVFGPYVERRARGEGLEALAKNIGPTPDVTKTDREAFIRVMKRAGASEPTISFVEHVAYKVPIENIAGMGQTSMTLRAVVRMLLADSVAEDRRWTERVKRLESRIGFAVDALHGKVEP